MDRIADKQGVLEAHEFFHGLPEPVLRRLAATSRTVSYAAGACIFTKGDEGFGLLAVLHGSVKISVISDDGREVVLNLITTGQVFGEIALLDGRPRTADAFALTKCMLLALDRRSFLPLLATHPPMAVRLLEVVSRRLRRTSEQVEDLSFAPSDVRLAKALFYLAEIQGSSRASQPVINIKQRELGSMVGLSRESTNKHLREWEEADVIALEKGICKIRRPDYLRKLVGPLDGS
jgi:CRP/FNR family cyclic AMP-dependent transcriptional regulator